MTKHSTLNKHINNSVELYLSTAGEHNVTNLHEIVMNQTEEILIQAIMKKVKNNQCRAAKLLGISRNTLRKLLRKYCKALEVSD